MINVEKAENHSKTKWLTKVILLSLLSLLFRLIYLYQYQNSPLFAYPAGPDVIEYLNRAKEILMGVFLWEHVHIHAPLYPYFLAFLLKISNGSFFFVRLVQSLLGICSMVLIMNSVKIHYSERAGFFTGLIWLFYSPLVFYEAELISEGLVLFFFSVAIYNLIKFHSNKKIVHLLPAGLSLGFAAISHPTSLLSSGLLCLILAYIFFKGEENKKNFLLKSLIMPILIAVVILPVTIRNQTVSGEFILIQKNEGLNFYIGNNKNSTGTCYVRPGAPWEKLTSLPDKNKAVKTLKERKKYYYDASYSFIKNQFPHYLKLLIKKAFLVFNYKEFTSGSDSPVLMKQTTFMKLPFLTYGLISIAALSFLIMSRNKNNILFICILLGYFIGMVIFVVSGRYRIAMLPVLLACTGCFIDFCLIKYKEHNWKYLQKSGAVFLLLAVFIYLPITTSLASAEYEKNRIYAESYIQQKRYKQALEAFEKTLDYQKNWSGTYTFYGRILSEFDTNKAIQNYNIALSINPNDSEALMNLGVIYSGKHQYNKAEKYFKHCQRVRPNYAQNLYNMALLFKKKGLFDKEKELYIKVLKLSPAHLSSLTNLGIFYFHKGDYKQAQKYYEKVLTLAPKKVNVLCNMALLLASQKKYKEAAQYFKKALEINPKFSQDVWKIYINIVQKYISVQEAKNLIKKFKYHFPK